MSEKIDITKFDFSTLADEVTKKQTEAPNQKEATPEPKKSTVPTIKKSNEDKFTVKKARLLTVLDNRAVMRTARLNYFVQGCNKVVVYQGSRDNPMGIFTAQYGDTFMQQWVRKFFYRHLGADTFSEDK